MGGAQLGSDEFPSDLHYTTLEAPHKGDRIIKVMALCNGRLNTDPSGEKMHPNTESHSYVLRYDRTHL